MKKTVYYFMIIIWTLALQHTLTVPAEAVWVAVNTSSYTLSNGVGYIAGGATVHCYGYHEWP
ncbi:MAG TPA: hypothetical protein PKL57_20130, partial [Candidatus Wallbacteria bacterium]|nr:hypothetical protein [Candidatus Wallbacteria bacterium]